MSLSLPTQDPVLRLKYPCHDAASTIWVEPRSDLVAKARTSKSNRTGPTYPTKDVPFIFVDDMSVVNSNKDTAKFYLYRNRPSLGYSDEDTHSEVVAELGMGINTFAFMALSLYGTLKAMMEAGALSSETLKIIQEGQVLVSGGTKRRAVSKAHKGKRKP
jgi:hypothetical protein